MDSLCGEAETRSCLGLLLIAVPHPLTAPEGVRTKTTAQGLSVHTHETRAWITQGSKMTHPKEWVEEKGPLCCFAQLRAHTHTHRKAQPAMIATSQAQREDLVVPHTCQRQTLRINQREAHTEKKLHTAVNSTNSQHSKLTGEQAAAHDNTHR